MTALVAFLATMHPPGQRSGARRQRVREALGLTSERPTAVRARSSRPVDRRARRSCSTLGSRRSCTSAAGSVCGRAARNASAARHLAAFLAGLGTLLRRARLAARRLRRPPARRPHGAAPAAAGRGAAAARCSARPLVPLLRGLPAGRVRRRGRPPRLVVALATRFSHPLVGSGRRCPSRPGAGTRRRRSSSRCARGVARGRARELPRRGAALLVAGGASRGRHGARWPRWAMIPYLLLADVQNTALAALLVFSDRVLYPSYATGGNPLDDQAAAGVLMWVPMSLAYLIPAAVLTARFLAPRTATARSSVRFPQSPARSSRRGSPWRSRTPLPSRR